MSRRIVLIGTAGCGKSTLSAQIFSSLKERGESVELVDEIVRREIQKNGPMQSIWEQYRTRAMQKEAEDAIPASVDWIVCDSGTLTPYFYGCHYADCSDKRQRLVLTDLYRYLIDDLFLNRYDYVFYLPFDLNTNTDDGTRFQNTEELVRIDSHMRTMFTNILKMPNVFEIAGPFNKRLSNVMNILLKK